MKKQFLLAVLICLGACGDLVPGTLWAVSRLDPLTTDPDDIAVRIDLPDSVALVPGSGKLTLGASRADGHSVVQDFALQQSGDVLFVSPDARTPLRALQARIKGWKDADPDGTKGSLSVTFDPCKTTQTLTRDLRASIHVRLQQNGDFLPLVENGPLDKVLQKVALHDMQLCP